MNKWIILLYAFFLISSCLGQGMDTMQNIQSNYWEDGAMFRPVVPSEGPNEGQSISKKFSNNDYFLVELFEKNIDNFIIRVWQTENGCLSREFQDKGAPIDFSFSQNDKHLIIYTKQGYVYLLNLVNFDYKRINEKENRFKCLAGFKDDQYYIIRYRPTIDSVKEQGSISYYNINSNKKIITKSLLKKQWNQGSGPYHSDYFVASHYFQINYIQVNFYFNLNTCEMFDVKVENNNLSYASVQMLNNSFSCIIVFDNSLQLLNLLTNQFEDKLDRTSCSYINNILSSFVIDKNQKIFACKVYKPDDILKKYNTVIRYNFDNSNIVKCYNKNDTIIYKNKYDTVFYNLYSINNNKIIYVKNIHYSMENDENQIVLGKIKDNELHFGVIKPDTLYTYKCHLNIDPRSPILQNALKLPDISYMFVCSGENKFYSIPTKTIYDINKVSFSKLREFQGPLGPHTGDFIYNYYIFPSNSIIDLSTGKFEFDSEKNPFKEIEWDDSFEHNKAFLFSDSTTLTIWQPSTIPTQTNTLICPWQTNYLSMVDHIVTNIENNIIINYRNMLRSLTLQLGNTSIREIKLQEIPKRTYETVKINTENDIFLFRFYQPTIKGITNCSSEKISVFKYNFSDNNFTNIYTDSVYGDIRNISMVGNILYFTCYCSKSEYPFIRYTYDTRFPSERKKVIYQSPYMQEYSNDCRFIMYKTKDHDSLVVFDTYTNKTNIIISANNNKLLEAEFSRNSKYVIIKENKSAKPTFKCYLSIYNLNNYNFIKRNIKDDCYEKNNIFDKRFVLFGVNKSNDKHIFYDLEIEDTIITPKHISNITGRINKSTITYYTKNHENNIFNTTKNIHAFWFERENDYVIKLDNSPYYACSKKAGDFMHFQDKYYHNFLFEELDPVFNRPDFVWEALGADPAVVAVYRAAVLERRKFLRLPEQIDFTNFHLPGINITNTQNTDWTRRISTVYLQFEAFDTSGLAYLNVYVNGVPLYSQTSLDTQKKLHEVRIPLGKGDNRVDVVALNKVGGRKINTMNFFYDPIKSLREDTIYYIGIGVNLYDDPNIKDLNYAEADITALLDSLRSVYGGRLKEKTLLGPEITIEALTHLKTWLLQAGLDDIVIIHFSGHGKTQNGKFYFPTRKTNLDNLTATSITIDAIDQLLDGLQSRKKLLLMDACESGLVEVNAVTLSETNKATNTPQSDKSVNSNIKNKKPAPPRGELTLEAMQRLFNDFVEGNGTTIISGSGGYDNALESNVFGGHGALTAAVLASFDPNQRSNYDNDNDGYVSLSELKTFIPGKVIKMTSGQQKPTIRADNLKNDFMLWKISKSSN